MKSLFLVFLIFLSFLIASAGQEMIFPTQISTLHREALRFKNEGKYSKAEEVFIERFLNMPPAEILERVKKGEKGG